MIHTATQTSKFKRLVRRVRDVLGGIPIDPETVCVGILERLWHATISNAIRGDIGRIENEEIAEAIGWHGDAQQIIQILIDTGWLDECSENRLLVHDWDQHAPKHVKGNVTKVGGFAKKALPLRPSPRGTAPEEQPLGMGAPNPTKRNVTKPNPTEPTNYRAREPDLGIVSFSSDDLLPTVIQIFTKLRYQGDKGKNLWKFAGLLQAHRITENELWDSCDEARTKGDDPPAYAFNYLRNRLRERPEPVELAELVKSVVVTPVCPSTVPEGSLL